MLLGLRRESAARFVFLLSLPAVLAAAVKEAMEVAKMGVEGLPVTLFLVGLVVSGIVGYITVKYLHPVSRRAHAARFCGLPAAAGGVTFAWLAARG